MGLSLEQVDLLYRSSCVFFLFSNLFSVSTRFWLRHFNCFATTDLYSRVTNSERGFSLRTYTRLTMMTLVRFLFTFSRCRILSLIFGWCCEYRATWKDWRKDLSHWRCQSLTQLNCILRLCFGVRFFDWSSIRVLLLTCSHRILFSFCLSSPLIFYSLWLSNSVVGLGKGIFFFDILDFLLHSLTFLWTDWS